jgi:hypothetical protein
MKLLDILFESYNPNDILYHTSNVEHKFSGRGRLHKGTFFSTDMFTSMDYGDYTYEVKLKPNLNFFDSQNIEHCKLLMQKFGRLHNDFYSKENVEVYDESLYYVYDPYQVCRDSHNWIIFEDNPTVMEWLYKTYDGVWVMESVRNLLIFAPIMDKILTIKMVSSPNKKHPSFYNN